ncbi:MAG: hypothetical protein H7039_02175 [Bryobacteraceae bacterium]|nr:hypothetical protein [Bryobacteraceae bacterium]
MNLIAITLTLVIASAACAAADSKADPVKTGNDVVEVKASALVGRESVKAMLGTDPGVEIIALQIEVRPKTDDGVKISRDDFILISRRDGQRSSAMHPSQIAGAGSMSVQTRGPGASGGTLGSPRRPIWGGIPGTGTQPSRIGGDNDVAVVSNAETKTSITDRKDLAENPLLAALKQKEITEGKSTDTVHGYVFYIFDGKHRLKDLELLYKTSDGNLILDFQK